MLLQLPPEITLNIASHLEFKDKLNLKTTCRKLNDQITTAVLFEEFILKNACDRLIQKLINNQFDGSLVKILHLNPDVLSDSFYSQLSDLFPNVNRVIGWDFMRMHMPGNSRKNKAVTAPLINWRNTIKSIFYGSDWRGLSDDLWHSKYPQLTSLGLHEGFDKLHECIGKNPRYSLFTNAPLLTRLCMFDPILNLEILEAMHAGFPLLQELKLIKLQFRLEKNDTLPLSIVPARHMIHLRLDFSMRLHKNGDILEYILKKYPNLRELNYSVCPSQDYYLKTFDEFQMQDYCGSFRGDSDSDEGDDSKGYEEAVYAHIARSEAKFRINSTLEAKFFSNLPKSMRHLTLETNNKSNAIAALAQSDAKITMLNLINTGKALCNRKLFDWNRKERVDTDILKHFENLTSLRTLRIAIDSSLQKFTPEFISSSITRLYIALTNGDFSIEWILSMFPLLEELYIGKDEEMKLKDSGKRGQCEVYNSGDDKKIRPSREYPKLRVLYIKTHTTHPKLFKFLTASAPNLKELELEIRLEDESSKVRRIFDFSNWSLSKCLLSFSTPRRSKVVDCNIVIQNIAKKIAINTVERTLFALRDRALDGSKSRRVEIVLNHVEKLKLFKSSIVTIGDKMFIEL